MRIIIEAIVLAATFIGLATVVLFAPGSEWSILKTLVIASVFVLSGVGAFEAVLHMHTPKHH